MLFLRQEKEPLAFSAISGVNPLIRTDFDEPDTPTYNHLVISEPYNKCFSNCWH